MSTKNLYDVLEVDSQASFAEIKKAFFKKVREIGGPERSPQKYKLLIEAYDTLGNEASRAEYDSMSEYGDEIEDLIAEAEELLDDEDDEIAQDAIKPLKEAVVLAPKVARLRNLLGIAFLRGEKFDSALEQFSKAIKIDDSNPSYWNNYGYASENLSYNQKAEDAYLKSIELDPHNNSNNIALVRFLHKIGRKNEAYERLEDAIMADGKIDFNDFSYFYHKISLLFQDGKDEDTRQVFEKVLEVADDEHKKEYAAWMFMSFSQMLIELKAYDLVEYLSEYAHKLVPSDQEYKNFYDAVKSIVQVTKEYEKIKDDETIHPLVKELLRIYVADHGSYLSNQEVQTQLEEIKEYIDNALTTYPDGKEIIASLKKIKQYHKSLYNLNSKLFDNLFSITPSYKRHRGKCPHCGETILVQYNYYGTYVCNSCNGAVEYNHFVFSKTRMGKGFSDCFVATAIYQDRNHPSVILLRDWRDSVLVNTLIGMFFIRIYYKIGPYLSKIVKKHIALQKVLKNILDEFVSYIKSRQQY